MWFKFNPHELCLKNRNTTRRAKLCVLITIFICRSRQFSISYFFSHQSLAPNESCMIEIKYSQIFSNSIWSKSLKLKKIEESYVKVFQSIKLRKETRHTPFSSFIIFLYGLPAIYFCKPLLCPQRWKGN